DIVKQYQLENDKQIILNLHEVLNAVPQGQKVSQVKNSFNSHGTIKRDKLILIMELLKIHSMDDIKQKGLIPRSTYYLYLKHLKRFGITKNSNFGILIIEIPALQIIWSCWEQKEAEKY